MYEVTKLAEYYKHQIESAKRFLWPPSLSKNCQKFCVNKPANAIKFLHDNRATLESRHIFKHI